MTNLGRRKVLLRALYLNLCGLPERTLQNGAARLNVTFDRPSLVMVCTLCGVPRMDTPCSAHIRAGSQTNVLHGSKQVTVASSTTPRQIIFSAVQSKRHALHHSVGLEDLMSKKFEQHMKCPSCMIGKSTLEDLPKLKDRADEPLAQVNMDSFSSSVPSIEVYSHAVVFADCNSGYRWLYGMKLKSEMLNVVKKWYSGITDLRLKHKLVLVM
jgi:hypothetical protein